MFQRATHHLNGDTIFSFSVFFLLGRLALGSLNLLGASGTLGYKKQEHILVDLLELALELKIITHLVPQELLELISTTTQTTLR